MANKAEKRKRAGASSEPFPDAAVEFLLEALAHSAEKVHGPLPDNWQEVLEWLGSNGYEAVDVARLYKNRQLPQRLLRLVGRLGGPKALNRHVSGRELCEGLCDLARQRWGYLAASVLRHWGIRSTRDIGRLVFALVEAGRLQKQPGDRMEDFDNVFDFAEAFDADYRIDLRPRSVASSTES